MKVGAAEVSWRRLTVLSMLLVGSALLAADLRRAPDRQLMASMAIRSIHSYQRTLAPLTRYAGGACRFAPSCSRYAEAVIQRYGFLKGGGRALARVVRCGPWTRRGTVDLPFDGYVVSPAPSPR
jgi:putative membrane protein insertion efficiency factor